MALRVSIFNWDNPERLEELLAYLGDHPGTIDEVALFTQISGSALPLATIREHARGLGAVLPKFKSLGLTAGINHLATVGHYDENLPHSLDEPWQRLVDVSGVVSRGCYCASDPDVQEYIRQVYIALAGAQPDFIWFDDDLRLEPHGKLVQYPCFCEGCLAVFSEESGQAWTRSTLRQAFRSGNLENRLKLRRQWLEHNRQYAARVLKIMRLAVDEVDPQMSLGFMSVEGSYSAYGMAEWSEALAGEKDLPVKCRPGGGYYDDRLPAESLAKAHWTGRQVAFLPQKVTDIQYEHENFPYQPLKKSRAIFQDEIAMALAVSCTGAAFNIMGLTPDPLGEYWPYLDDVRTSRTFYDRAAQAFGRSPNLGFWPGFSRDHSAALNLTQDWFATPLWGVDFSQFCELGEIGLPMAYSPEGASLSVLSRTSVIDLGREQVLKLLAGGIMLDGPALGVLEGMGLAELAGFGALSTVDTDIFEAFTDDPLNAEFAGWMRDCHPTFFPDAAYMLEPMAGARVLAEVADFEMARHGACAGVFENRMGGRVAVMGYYPWILLQSLAKSTQVKRLFRWLSKDTLPAYVFSYTKAGLWCRTDARGRVVMLLVNASIDPAPEVLLNALTGGAERSLVRMDGSETILLPLTQDGPYSRYALPLLQPWEAVLIV